MIAVERDSRTVVAMIEEAHRLGGDTVIPASVLGQVWRGGPRAARLAKLIVASEVDTLDERRAREVGERLGDRDGSDVVDAHVACCAAECEAIVATSDQGDMEALIGPDEAVALVPV